MNVFVKSISENTLIAKQTQFIKFTLNWLSSLLYWLFSERCIGCRRGFSDAGYYICLDSSAVERRTHIPEVEGSNPSRGTNAIILK